MMGTILTGFHNSCVYIKALEFILSNSDIGFLFMQNMSRCESWQVLSLLTHLTPLSTGTRGNVCTVECRVRNRKNT
jgi:hypothetical protein